MSVSSSAGQSTTSVETVMKFGTSIHVDLRMSCNDFSDALTFHLLPPSSQNLFYKQMLAC